ncbi:hypothetical protein BPAE_0058g00130 [Botrytis paeoniae]|uniref:Uncharacterized protein n=1 Tax=Botrytis paeoniae TaxID=278948 RepID=A0A4Z1FPR2_9HELO|nr:hypothetical protein BPAE_0058g00130 [Botrytis paeoniae]
MFDRRGRAFRGSRHAFDLAFSPSTRLLLLLEVIASCLESKSGAENGLKYSSFCIELSPVTAIVGEHPRNNMEQTGIVSARADTLSRDLSQINNSGPGNRGSDWMGDLFGKQIFKYPVNAMQ